MKKILALCVALACQMAVANDDIVRTLHGAGLTLPVRDVRPSVIGQLLQVRLDGAEPIFITKDKRYVLQGTIEPNPSPVVQIADELKTPQRAGTPVSSAYKRALLANMTALKNLTADTVFFYTNVQGLLWGTSGVGGVPFLVSDDGRYFINGDISVIKDGRFAGLDTDFEWTKNRHILSVIDENWLTVYPAKPQKAVMYVATDTHCPYCRLLHKQIGVFNAKGITVKVIGYPTYDEAYEPMRQIWCQADNDKRAKLLSLAMTGVMPKVLCQDDTENNLLNNQILAQSLAVIATPAIYRDDGVLFEGDFRDKALFEFFGVR
ncbi:MAG: thioredoxin fold domain-containing protein [Moraxella sp.]|nr:thioredoxin fold domain-containing protein [Moraxella sp.]